MAESREEGAALLAAVTLAIAAERMKAAIAGRIPQDADLARAVLRSPALQDANRRNLDAMLAGAEPEVTALIAGRAVEIAEVAIAAERERIRQMAIRNNAVCVGDEGTSCYFAELLKPEGQERSGEKGAGRG